MPFKLILVILTLTPHMGKTAEKGPEPVKNLQIERYQGLWNQLSTIPASFQKDCIKNTTAEYSLLPEGTVKVVNSCDQKNNRKKSEARARINKDYGLNSTLEVTFVKIFNWIWSFAGDYWIIYINENYTVAIVGHPSYEYGWILSKKETLNLNEYKRLGKELIQQGYDTCDFVMSNTPSQFFDNDTRLCDLVN